jgi:hypothetical protein
MPMKKMTMAAIAATFSLTDFPSGDRAKLEDQIVERALQLCCKKRRPRQKFKIKNWT